MTINHAFGFDLETEVQQLLSFLLKIKLILENKSEVNLSF